MVAVVVALALAASGSNAAKLELRGQVQPPYPGILANLSAQQFPFDATVTCDKTGRFRFTKLAPGAYTLSVFVRGEGLVRKSVQLDAAKADSKGVVWLDVAFKVPDGDTSVVQYAKRTGAVPFWALQIAPKARREYRDARRALSEQRIEDTIRHLKKAVEMSPEFAAAWQLLGQIAFQSDRLAEAEMCFRRVLAQDPDALESIVNLGAVLLNRNRCAEALPYSERAVRELPTDAATNSQLGKNYLCLGDAVRALQYFSAAKQIDPGHYSKPQLALAMIYMSMGADLLARAELDEALARFPDDGLAIDLKKKLAERTRQFP